MRIYHRNIDWNMADTAIATDRASIDLRSGDGSASPNEHVHIYDDEDDGEKMHTPITDDHAPVPSDEAAVLIDVPEDQVS